MVNCCDVEINFRIISYGNKDIYQLFPFS